MTVSFPMMLGASLLSLIIQAQLAFAQITPSVRTDPSPIKIAFVGDIGVKNTSYATMRLIKKEGANLLLVLGDYDYRHDPQAWEAMLDDTLGKEFPILAVVGNHDVREWDTYKDQWTSRLRAHMPEVTCAGDYGVKGTCRVGNILFVMSGIGTLGDDNANRIQAALQDNDAVWKICAWHKNQPLMQVGFVRESIGWPAYERCREAGAFVVSGHNHAYARSYLMSSFAKQAIVNKSNQLTLAPGHSFVAVSGLGGESRARQFFTNDWWAKIYTKQTGDAQPGALFCDFNIGGNPRLARCAFKNIAGEIIDQFSLVSSLPAKRPD